jgi:hypothetical protein
VEREEGGVCEMDGSEGGEGLERENKKELAENMKERNRG